MLDAAARGMIRLEQVVESFSRAPAQRFGIYPKKGTIQPGSDADVMLWDPQGSTTVDVESLLSRAAESAIIYQGLELQGRIRHVILRGSTIYADNKVVGGPEGRFVRPIAES